MAANDTLERNAEAYSGAWIAMAIGDRNLSEAAGSYIANLVNVSDPLPTNRPGARQSMDNAAACPQLAKADRASSSQHVREGQRINGAAGEHGNVCIRRKQTCRR